MSLLALGVLLFAGVHLFPSLAPQRRLTLRDRLGENGYKSAFSLLLFAALALTVLGWRSVPPRQLYLPPAVLHLPALALAAAAFLLFTASMRQSRLNRVFRHPQLAAVILWSLAHLLLNGDDRSLLLFGGLGLWARIEMSAINRREGVWLRPPVPPWGQEFATLLIAVAVVALVVAIHPWLAGVAVR